MRRLTTQPCQARAPESQKPRSSLLRPLQNLPQNCFSPHSIKPVKPFQLLNENLQPRDPTLRLTLRQSLESRSEHHNLHSGFKDLKSQLCQLRDLLDEKPDRKGLENYLNARLQQVSLEMQSRNNELKNMLAQMDRSVNERLQQMQGNYDGVLRQVQDGRLNRKGSLPDCSRLQMLEANVENLFMRMDAMAEGSRGSFGKRAREKDTPSNEDFVDLSRDIRTVRTELKLEVAEITQGLTSLQQQVKQCTKQLKQKMSRCDVSQMLEQLNQKCAQSALNIQKINTVLQQLHQQRDMTQRSLSKLHQKHCRLQSSVDSTISQLRLTLQQQLCQLSTSTQQRISKIVTSYNTNFQQIDQNTSQLKQMMSQVLNINGIITQKLVGTITNKLDCMTFQSAMENLNEHMIETLHSNARKINEINDKEFEVEHEIRAIKEMLTGLRQEKVGQRVRTEQHEAAEEVGWESDRKSTARGARQYGFREVSPYLMSPRVDDCRFRKADTSMYEAAGGRYNNSSIDKSLHFKETCYEEDEPFQTTFSKIPSLSQELASL